MQSESSTRLGLLYLKRRQFIVCFHRAFDMTRDAVEGGVVHQICHKYFFLSVAFRSFLQHLKDSRDYANIVQVNEIYHSTGR